MPLSRRARERAIALPLDGFSRQTFHEAAQFAVELGLFIGPVADHLLLAAHVLHETLDRFGEVRHRRRRSLSGRPVTYGLLQSRQRIDDPPGRRATADRA